MKNIKLKELGELVTGNTPSKQVEEFYESNDIPFIKPDGLQENRILYVSTTKEYISKKAEAKARILSKGSVLVTCIGTIGKVGIIDCDKMAFNQQINAVVPNNAKIDTKYLAYVLKQNKQSLANIANAAVVPIINKTQFGEFCVNIHEDIYTQQKIVNILDKSQELINKRKEQIDACEKLVKSQFIEMFGNPIVNSKQWELKELRECLINIENGKSFVCESGSRVGEFPAILKLSAATYGIYRPEENKALTDKVLFVETAEVHSGDLLFTRKNTPELVGMCAYVYDTPPNLMMPDLIFRLNTRENCNKIFLWQLINHELFRGSIKNIASGSAKSMSNISKERLMKLTIPLPPIELQNQFEQFVKQTNKLKFEMQKSLIELENNFNSLMQRAFKGELF